MGSHFSVCLCLSGCSSLSVSVCLPVCLSVPVPVSICLCLWMSFCLSLPESCKAVMNNLLFYGKLPRKGSLSCGRSSRPQSSADGRLVPLPAFLRLSFDSPVSSRRWISKCHIILQRHSAHARARARAHTHTRRGTKAQKDTQ